MRTDLGEIGIPVVKRGLQLSALALGLLALGAGQSRAVPMSELLAGGSITCLDKTFTNFHAFSSVGTGGADAPTADQVSVIADPSTCGPGADPLGVPGPGILIQSAQWNVNTGQSIDTAFSYDVIPGAGFSIHDADLILESFAADGGGDIHITESLFDALNNNIANLAVDALAGPITDHHDFAPVSFLTVNKDISLEGHDGTASLSTFRQDFSQVPVPEPASLGIIGLGLVGLGWLRRRRAA